jgi:hypothetical protein
MSDVTSGDWLQVGVGVVFGVLGLAIAQRARRAQRGDRDQDRAEQRAEADRLARRESWVHLYQEVVDVLKTGHRIAWFVRERGPLTERKFDDLQLTRFVMEAEQLAVRAPAGLRPSLERLSLAGARLLETAERSSPEDVRVPEGENLPAERANYAECRLAVEQERAAQALKAELGEAWEALRREWGA